MNKRIGLIWFKFLGLKSPKNIKSVTFMELIIAMMVVAIMVLSFYSLETYGHQQLIGVDRRAKVQNSLAYVLDHMSKYVQQGNGDINNPGIVVWPVGNPRSFQVRVDFNGTPADSSDDPWVRYQLRPADGVLTVSCNGGVGCPAGFNEDLSAKVRSGFVNNSILPEPLPANPSGFYVWIVDGGSSINIGLVGLYDTSVPYTLLTRLTNPQVALKTKLTCSSCSTN